MKHIRSVSLFVGMTAALTLILGVVWTPVYAHCDTLDGPVVMAAKKALDKDDVRLVLIWVQPKDEAEIKDAYQKTLAVRKLNPDARAMADLYFFETLVRLHRAGEGAPYTGLKSARRNLGPAIPAADEAVESGSIDRVRELLVDSLNDSLEDRFKEVMEKKEYKTPDVTRGREFVKAYVTFIHFVEKLYQDASEPAEAHLAEHEAPAHNEK
ncbi:MAG: DUF6448 family protein [Elusimicrobia bacterium]|nr:DUF6448 family protein [Candidatus Obscuribacterium magneticum]